MPRLRKRRGACLTSPPKEDNNDTCRCSSFKLAIVSQWFMNCCQNKPTEASGNKHINSPRPTYDHSSYHLGMSGNGHVGHKQRETDTTNRMSISRYLRETTRIQPTEIIKPSRQIIGRPLWAADRCLWLLVASLLVICTTFPRSSLVSGSLIVGDSAIEIQEVPEDTSSHQQQQNLISQPPLEQGDVLSNSEQSRPDPNSILLTPVQVSSSIESPGSVQRFPVTSGPPPPVTAHGEPIRPKTSQSDDVTDGDPNSRPSHDYDASSQDANGQRPDGARSLERVIKPADSSNTDHDPDEDGNKNEKAIAGRVVDFELTPAGGHNKAKIKKKKKKKKKMESGEMFKKWVKKKKQEKKMEDMAEKKHMKKKKEEGKKKKKKWGLEEQGHKKKGKFKKKKWGHKVKKGKGIKKGKKGKKFLKDKGHKSSGFKNVYHKEEWGKSNKWHDLQREKKWDEKSKKWKKKWKKEKGKKYKGDHMKKYEDKKKHGKKYAKEQKEKHKKFKKEKFEKGKKMKKEQHMKKKEGGEKKKELKKKKKKG